MIVWQGTFKGIQFVFSVGGSYLSCIISILIRHNIAIAMPFVTSNEPILRTAQGYQPGRRSCYHSPISNHLPMTHQHDQRGQLDAVNGMITTFPWCWWVISFGQRRMVHPLCKLATGSTLPGLSVVPDNFISPPRQAHRWVCMSVCWCAAGTLDPLRLKLIGY